MKKKAKIHSLPVKERNIRWFPLPSPIIYRLVIYRFSKTKIQQNQEEAQR